MSEFGKLLVTFLAMLGAVGFMISLFSGILIYLNKRGDRDA